MIGPSWVGDLVIAQGLLMAIKNQWPNSQIDVMAPEWNLPLLNLMPEVNNSILLPFNHRQLALNQRFKLGKKLRTKNYEQAFIIPNSLKSALVPWFANIPVRTGWLGEHRFGLINDWRILDKKRYVSIAQRYQALAYPKNSSLNSIFFIPKLKLDMQYKACVKSIYNIDNTKPWIAICPGSEYGTGKRWPSAHFAQLAKLLIEAGFKVMLLGSPNDASACLEIYHLCQEVNLNLCGKSTLLEAIYLLDMCNAVVSNDSGLMHLAASLNKSLVSIYGPTASNFAPPLSVKAEVIENKELSCRPCKKRQCPFLHHWCMQSIKPKDVFKTLIRLL